MKKAVLYARAWPSQIDSEEKIKMQLEFLKNYCEKKNMIVWDIYEDVTDGYTSDTMAFLTKINGVSTGRGEADILLAVDLKLFARGVLNAVVTTNLFRDRELEVYHFARRFEQPSTDTQTIN